MKLNLYIKLCCLSILGLMLCASYIPQNMNFPSCTRVNNLPTDTLTRLKVLKAKKWVGINETSVAGTIYRTEGDIMEFSDKEVTYTITYLESYPEGLKKNHAFYLSNTPDKVFDHKKQGAQNGKYLIVKSFKYWKGTSDNTIVFEILELTPILLKKRRILQHNEVIIGSKLTTKSEGRTKDTPESN